MAPSNNIQLPSLQQLQSAEQVELMDVVDSLRAQGLSEFTALPQWIVCGDQSSGKSSLLEAISGIPFPRHENLCTRFATEVILRRAPRHRISVSIIPSKDRKGAERALLLQFRHELSALDDFPKLFKMAKEAMGLSSTSKSLSDNVLRVEFCGPSQPQLTLVDLPGLFHSHGKSQSEEDVSLVHNLVSQYIENPRSIILAVLSAKYDYNNQIIIRKVRDVDPKGSRVLGIITKPDTLPKGSDSEKTFIALAKNEEVRFDLGWHVVRNLDSSVSDISDVRQASRDEQETQYFKESAFNCLPSHTIGIASLRNRLSKLLFNQIRTELPQLAIDIESQMAAATALRDRLGPSRLAGYEQRSFLTHLSQDFQAICRDAVRGDYDDVFFRVDDNPERRLCANLMNLHFKFARNLRKRGAYWIIEDEKTQKSDSASINGESIDYSGSEESNQEESDDEANDDDESEDDAIDESRLRTREEAIKEASKLLKRSRGRELPGLPNPLLVGELFREYSRPWEELAKRHIKNVWEATNQFLELVLKHLTDEEASDKIFSFWIYPIMEQKLEAAHRKLDELIEVHKDHPITTNPQFIENRKKPRHKQELELALQNEFKKPSQKITLYEMNEVLSYVDRNFNLDIDLMAAEEALDNMNAFYEVALNLFMDNVPTLAIQTPIVREVPKILCPTAVHNMDAELVKKIAGESEEKSNQRTSILRKIEVLENGARICGQYSRRSRNRLAAPHEISTSQKLATMHNFERNNEYNKTVDQERVVLGSNHEESAVSELGDQEPVAPPSIQTSQATKSKAALVSKTSQPKNEKDLPKESAEKSALTTKPTLEPALVISSSEGSASAISTPTSTPGKTPKSTRKQKAVKASPEPSTFAKPPSSSSHTASTSGGGLFGGGISAPQPIIASPGGLFGTSAPKEIPTCGTDPVGETRPSSGFFTGFGGFGAQAASNMTPNLFGAKSSGSPSPVPAFGLASASTASSNGGTGLFGSKPASVSASDEFGSDSGSAKTSTPFSFGRPSTGTSGNLFGASSILENHAIK